MYAMMLLVPFFLIPRLKTPGLAFAIGQFVTVRTDALTAVGGYESIRDSITDDMSMAGRMKQCGRRNIFLNANNAVTCRLYRGYTDAFRGIERSSFSAVGGSPVQIAAAAVIALGFIVGPALLALLSLLRLQAPDALVTVAVALFAVQWAVVTLDRASPVLAFVLYPLIFLDLVVLLTASMVSTGFGPGVDWKGRIVRVPRRGGLAPDATVAECPPGPGDAGT